jgi:phenylalanyl-tRNA synthetase beta chain
MKIPLSWLKEYIDCHLPPAQIAKMLTMNGLEVDGIETVALGFQKVIVVKVIDVQKHPTANKLSIATVTDGVNSYQVVCGAPNCRPGIKTAFAMVGATLVNDQGTPYTIKSAKIRGVDSFGMLCTGKELGLSESHEVILEFADQLTEGADVAEMFADTVFDISLTPNLAHCASVMGVARELSAAMSSPVRYPEITVEEIKEDVSSAARVQVRDSTNCPRYVCRVIKDVKVAPSPVWLEKRLSACGIRSVNNIVDITNYVLMEMGHPLHAFDLDLLDGKEIRVRSALEGERFVTLDGKEQIMKAQDLLICDKEKPVAIAGVMGGLNSEVSDNTHNILIESAYFLPTSIRKTSKQLHLQTEASKRFERGCDPNILVQAVDRAAMLIQQIAGGGVYAGVIDVAERTFPEKHITCRLSRINHVLGTHLSVSEVESVFNRLQLPHIWNGRDTFTVRAPTYRVDLQSEIDLIEDIARIYGYDNIGMSNSRFHGSTLPHAPIFLFEREVRSQLVAEGLQEFLTSDLIGPTLMEIVRDDEMPEESVIRVLNPTSIEQSILRTSLLPGLLQVVKYNWDHQNHHVSGFEIGRIHFKEGDQYKEQTVAGIVLSGKSRPHHWDQKPHDFDFFDLKGVVENVLQELRINDLSFQVNRLDTFHPGRRASVYVGSFEIGSLGEVHPTILRRLDVPQRIFFAELNLHDLFKVQEKSYKMEDIPIYPGSERDWTITLREEIPIADVFDMIDSTASPLLEKTSLLDVYRSEKLGQGLKNVTFRFMYRDTNKTVAQESVEAEHRRLTNEVLNLLTTKLTTG